MKRLIFISIFFLSISTLVSCSSESTDDVETNPLNPSESYEELNISYGAETNQVFDLYLPANRTSNTKAIILVHGGGWTSGDKTDMNDIKTFIKDQMTDYAVVNMNYR